MTAESWPKKLLESATHVRMETPDLDGTLRGKVVDVSKVAKADAHIMMPEAYLSLTVGEEITDEGIGSPDSGYGDMVLRPDWSTAHRVEGQDHVVTVLCDGYTKDGRDHPIHPRSMLKRIVADAAKDGFEGIFGTEYEFWLFRLDDATAQALREGRISDLTPVSRQSNAYSLARWADCPKYFEELLATMAAVGAPLESLLAELGQGMFEAALAPLPAVQAADAAARFKLVARELAAKHGLLVSFVAKLNAVGSGSSGHLHQSLTQNGKNLFWGGAQDQLSEIGRSYLAGLMQATRDCGVVMAPYPNSYRRFDREFFAPDSASWGYDNRQACVRAIVLDETSSRFELRRPGADLQPYLTIAASLAGGVHGVRHELPAPPESVGRCDPLEGSELASDLSTAIAQFEHSEFSRQLLGDPLVDAYAQLRRAELRAYQNLARTMIPAWELARYLEVV